MSCDIANFYPIACTNTTINLCEIEDSGQHAVKLTHTGNKKDYWFNHDAGTTVTIDVSSFDVDTNVPYEFTVYKLSSGQGDITPFGEVGAVTYPYNKGIVIFSPSKSESATLPTTATLELK